MTDPDIDQLARALACELGDGWTATRDPDDRRPSLRHPDGRELAVRRIWNQRDRVAVTGVLPRTDLYQPTRTSITVALARGAQVIAREITRRALPEYTAAFAEVLAYNRAQQDHRAQRSAVLERLRTILGGHVRDDRHEHTLHAYLTTGTSSEEKGFRSVDVRAHGDGERVDIKLTDVPAALAEQIALLVTRGIPGRRNPLHPRVQQVLDQLDLSTPLTAAGAAARIGLPDADSAVVLDALHAIDLAAADDDGYRLTLTGRTRQSAPARPTGG